MAAVPSPAAPSRLPAPRPRRDAGARGKPHLRVVGPPRHTTRFAVAVGVVTALAIFGIVSLHALAAEAAFASRSLEAEIAELSMRHDELTADVARLESPDRIRRVATDDLGMVSARQPAYVVLDGAPVHDGPVAPQLADPLERPASGG